MTNVWADIKPKFEEASGHQLDIFFGTTPNLIKEATSGQAFDLGVVPIDVMKDAAARAEFVAAPTIDIASVGLGVAVRSGAQKPDIATASALKATLLNASSIASIPESATGYSIARAFARLGITDAMQAKTKAQLNPAQVVAAVAKGDAELGIFLLNVLIAPGLEIVGPFPDELQEKVVFTAAVATDTRQEAAKALIDYLKSDAAVAVIKAKGMKPSSLPNERSLWRTAELPPHRHSPGRPERMVRAERSFLRPSLPRMSSRSLLCRSTVSAEPAMIMGVVPSHWRLRS
jgi:molybdate transport system substrate-binding protein